MSSEVSSVSAVNTSLVPELLLSTFQSNMADISLATSSPCSCSGSVISDGLSCSCDDATDDVGDTFIPWNNPDNVITRETLILFEKIVTCYINVVLLTFGVPTNVINAIVFYRQGLKDRMNLCLFSLSIVDMMCVLIWFLLGSFCFVGHVLEDFRDMWKWQVRKYLRGFHRGFYYSSGCLTMIVAVDRCTCVTLPLKAHSLIKTRTMGILILSTVLTLQLLCSVYLFNFNVIPKIDPATNQTIAYLPPTRVYIDLKQFIDITENTVIMVAIPSFTFTVVSVATLATVLKLKQSIAWRENSTSSNSFTKSQTALVKMLIIVSCIYIVTTAPNVILGIVRSQLPDFWLTGRYANIFVASHILYLLIGTVNSSVNFIVYMIRSSKFRNEVFRMTSLFRRHKKQTENSCVTNVTLQSLS